MLAQKHLLTDKVKNSGNVSISDVKNGSVYIVNGVGNIAVTNTKAVLDIKNGEGDIKLDYVSGDFLINPSCLGKHNQ